MKNLMRVLSGIIIGSAITVLTFGDNAEDIIKVATMQVDTVYCKSLIELQINTDTIRTYYKDKLIIVTGVNDIFVDYNVKKSEWIDSILLTKPNKIKNDDYVITIYYNDLSITYYSITGYVYLKNNKGEYIIIDSVTNIKRHKVSKETLNNINVIINRYFHN